MASKSKKRRKVLGASCILAALIIAGSSFAWFTSKDEVINRLTANADYGVSIVESFAPPENWVPGQEVNKDVYAVNTGNVGAFVEETVSGTLTITTEVAKSDISANSVKLTAAERYAVEAGSYLAYKPAESNKELGVQVVSMIPDATKLEGYTTADATTDFTPDAAGLYVFRRSIGVDPITKIETFKYEGYYFDGHDFYKVTDLKVVPDTVSYAGDNVTTDGNLTGATAKFVEEETKTINPTALTYDIDNNRLVASYDTGAEITNAKLQDLAEAYDNALVLYNDAVAEYTAALRENTGADAAVVNANQTLQEKLDDLRDAQNTLATAEKNLAQATAAKNAAQAAKEAADQRATEAAAALTAADDAVTAAQTAKDAADAAVTAAQGNLDAANADSKAAYYAYLKTRFTEIAEFTDNQIETWLANTATYNEIFGLGIDNENDVKYNYHQLAVALKEAQRNAADKAAALAAAQATQAQKVQALADANAAKDAAQAAKDAADQRASEAAAALTAAEAAVTAAQTEKGDAEAAVAAAQTAANEAQEAYDEAVTNAGETGTSGNLTTAKNNLAAATQKLAEAEKAYNDAMNSADKGVLKININLADVVTTTGTADKWQLLPDPVNGGTAYFYYTSILGGGETSAQLIDSV